MNNPTVQMVLAILREPCIIGINQGNVAKVVPTFKKEIVVAKKDKIAPAKDVKQETPPAADGAEAKAPPAPKQRGPRGTTEEAKITVLAKENPKRAGSKAAAAFANYRDGMTIKEFADTVGKEATGHLVYDSKHGYIAIEGYDPGAIIVPKPKAEKKVKEPKAKKEKSPVDPAKEQAKADVENTVVEETMD